MQDTQSEIDRPGTGADMSLLLVDDDKPFLTRLARAMEGRGYIVRIADSASELVDNRRGADCQS